MAIDLTTERRMSVNELRDWRGPGRNGRPMSPNTAYIWMTRGVRGVKLESVKIGGIIYTSAEALERFVSALSAARSSRDSAAPIPTPAARKRRLATVDRELDALGV